MYNCTAMSIATDDEEERLEEKVLGGGVTKKDVFKKTWKLEFFVPLK